ncbi:MULTISPECIES: MOSC domain-containing protein [unclassified Streptomyces]|uniref:MOSC domain-containing protein n=1 Tax=unclassified Streptomyces TaxID=2593676 RepID=UPI001BE7CEAE|nr:MULTISPECIES: MOSC domain-containing protein [unclassified Streptomyces]MBT2402423.1 MOSC domain-containing protein [Streptomyces sp. ISL-21]MBT2611543.1 MOSC domain-containing protein [Streptomyces sp. ISL-87]
MHLISVNLGRATVVDYTDAKGAVTGIGKRPVPGPVRVFAPGPKGIAAGGVEGDDVCDLRHHGGDHQAVYAYAREDLDWWERELGRELPGGIFGENFTTSGIDVNGALLGERWRVGPDLVLEVASARIPCRTFQGALGETGWVKRFTQEARPGAYLRVIEEGSVSPGDTIEILHRPDHEVTVDFWFRAFTTERTLLPRTTAAGAAMEPAAHDTVRAYVAKQEKRETREKQGSPA